MSQSMLTKNGQGKSGRTAVPARSSNMSSVVVSDSILVAQTCTKVGCGRLKTSAFSPSASYISSSHARPALQREEHNALLAAKS